MAIVQSRCLSAASAVVALPAAVAIVAGGEKRFVLPGAQSLKAVLPHVVSLWNLGELLRLVNAALSKREIRGQRKHYF